MVQLLHFAVAGHRVIQIRAADGCFDAASLAKASDHSLGPGVLMLRFWHAEGWSFVLDVRTSPCLREVESLQQQTGKSGTADEPFLLDLFNLPRTSCII